MRKKDDHNKKTSHLILEMSMNEAFIWLSRHRIIDRENLNGFMGDSKTFGIPEAKGLNLSTGVLKINGFGPNEHLVGDCFRKLYEPGDAYW